MKLNYITIMVRNMEKSVEFYQELVGLYITHQMQLPVGKIVFLANNENETKIELIEFQNSVKAETEGVAMSYHADEDLGIVRDRALTLGYEPSEIITQGQKPEHFTVNDPDGIKVEFSK